MSQTKKQTHIEVTTNQITGIAIGWSIVMFLFPYFNHLPQEQVVTISSVIFFASSYIRSYIIRRYFNRRVKKEKS